MVAFALLAAFTLAPANDFDDVGKKLSDLDEQRRSARRAAFDTASARGGFDTYRTANQTIDAAERALLQTVPGMNLVVVAAGEGHVFMQVADVAARLNDRRVIRHLAASTQLPSDDPGLRVHILVSSLIEHGDIRGATNFFLKAEPSLPINARITTRDLLAGAIIRSNEPSEYVAFLEDGVDLARVSLDHSPDTAREMSRQLYALKLAVRNAAAFQHLVDDLADDAETALNDVNHSAKHGAAAELLFVILPAAGGAYSRSEVTGTWLDVVDQAHRSNPPNVRVSSTELRRLADVAYLTGGLTTAEQNRLRQSQTLAAGLTDPNTRVALERHFGRVASGLRSGRPSSQVMTAREKTAGVIR